MFGLLSLQYGLPWGIATYVFGYLALQIDAEVVG